MPSAYLDGTRLKKLMAINPAAFPLPGCIIEVRTTVPEAEPLKTGRNELSGAPNQTDYPAAVVFRLKNS
jgi:hypothetical protein